MTEKRNLKNPFASFNASLMDDDEIIEYWIQPQILFEQQAIGVDLTGKIPVVLEGGRGTGKTTLLKFMSNEVQIKKYLLEHDGCGDNFLKDIGYIGIYYRFDGPSLSSFHDRHVEDMVWETLFSHYFDIIIGYKYIYMLNNLRKNRCLSLHPDIEKKIVYDILNIINIDVENLNGSIRLETLSKILQNMAKDVSQFINEAPFSKNIEFKGRPIISSGDLIFGVPQVLRNNIPEFDRKKIILLLDEYENLLLRQQIIINTLIKHVKTPLTFRIGTRLHGFKTFDTLNEEEFLLEDADYRKILFEDILISHGTKYKELLKKVARKRLKSIPGFEEHELLDIEKWLGNLRPSEEALNVVGRLQKEKLDIEEYKEAKHIKEIVKELADMGVSKYEIDNLLPQMIYPENPLIEMLNLLLLRRGYPPREVINLFSSYKKERGTQSTQYKKYKDLYDKNELALLFQLISIYSPKQKMYAGFRVFSMLSSGIIRNFLELCYQSFNISLFSYGEDILKNGKISFKDQTEGSEIRAEKFFKTIERIPRYGNEIKSLVRSLGAIFYTWQSDPRIKEPEVTYFCVDKTVLSDEARKILDTAVQWSVLQEKRPMKGKMPTDPLLDVYALNHILAPYFKISYRLRGRIPQFYKEDIEILMFGNEDEKKKVVKRLGAQMDSDKNQLTLFDFLED